MGSEISGGRSLCCPSRGRASASVPVRVQSRGSPGLDRARRGDHSSAGSDCVHYGIHRADCQACRRGARLRDRHGCHGPCQGSSRAPSWICPEAWRFRDLIQGQLSQDSFSELGKQLCWILTDSSAFDLDVLQVVYGSVSFIDSVVLDEAIGRLERNLGQATKPVKQIEHIPLGHLVTREVTCGKHVSVSCGFDGARSRTNEYTRALRKAVPFGLRHVLPLVAQELLPSLLIFTIRRIGGRC